MLTAYNRVLGKIQLQARTILPLRPPGGSNY
jgi:hypothetical protein